MEGHGRGFRTSPQLAPCFEKVKPYFAQIREMKHHQVLQRGRGAAAGGEP